MKAAPKIGDKCFYKNSYRVWACGEFEGFAGNKKFYYIRLNGSLGLTLLHKDLVYLISDFLENYI